MTAHFEARCSSSVGEREVPSSRVLQGRRESRSARRRPKEEGPPGWGLSMVVCLAGAEEVASSRWGR